MAFLPAAAAMQCTIMNPSYVGDEAESLDARRAVPGNVVGADAGEPPLSRDLDPVGDARAVLDQPGIRDSGAPDRGGDMAAPSLCDPLESSFQTHCYSVVEGQNAMTYPEAKQACLDHQAKPASITTADEDDLIYGLLPAASTAAWLGLKRSAKGNSDFAWESGESLVYANWSAGEPNNEGGSENCGVMWGPAVGGQAQPGHWNDAPCDWPRSVVVCERVPY